MRRQPSRGITETANYQKSRRVHQTLLRGCLLACNWSLRDRAPQNRASACLGAAGLPAHICGMHVHVNVEAGCHWASEPAIALPNTHASNLLGQCQAVFRTEPLRLKLSTVKLLL